MARITKDPQVRMTEILDATEELFYARGYHETAISDIVKSIGVAQGTFYYYFKSKEEILEALINRQMSRFLSEAEKIVSAEEINPLQKLELFVQTTFHTIRYKDGLLFEFLFDDQHLHLLGKLSRQGEELLMPLLLKIIEEGEQKKVFTVMNSRVALAFVGGIMNCLIDAIYEKLSTDLFEQHVKMAIILIEKTVGLREKSLHIHI
ncbi:MAG: TetR/AcrR family transcriptional regulator [Negativicutes bacterium]